MKINKNIEQGIFILLILALQKNHEPVKSNTISHVLDVSDSYLKKTLRRLVLAGLINSSASKDGGFTLAKSIRTITVSDVFKALDVDCHKYNISKMSRRIFEDEEHIISSEQKILSVFQASTDDFFARLDTLNLSELIKDEYIDMGYFNWQDK